jgi:hypothetical protein
MDLQSKLGPCIGDTNGLLAEGETRAAHVDQRRVMM